MKKTLLSTTGLVLALLLFLGFNILSGAALKTMRVDLTENRLFTLSQGTLNLLANLQELLEQYVARSHGKISLEVIDPQPYTDEEDKAAQYGLEGKPANAAGEMFY